jgi:5-oxopent-3-ene-1,2,5-tricarboxylate decarboxylase/2-hydroxyhepta-2,4-diene-1,7-dioate isomerase
MLSSLLPETLSGPIPGLSGMVYGTLLNSLATLASIGDAAQELPYRGAPRAPVLSVKPRNTLVGPGAVVTLPVGVTEVEIGPALGLVIGRPACALREPEALSALAGYIVVADLSVPHDSFYRPSVRLKAWDGACPIGPGVVARAAVADPDALPVQVWVDGEPVHSTTTGGMQRPAARLLAEVTDFMTLSPGDVLMLGVGHGAPRARAGQRVAIEIGGVGRLEFSLVAARTGTAAADAADADADATVSTPTATASAPSTILDPADFVPRARVAHAGAVYDATPCGEHQLRLADGRVVDQGAVVWLPPFEVGTVIALGLNYADHARELKFAAQDNEPLVFLKGRGSLIGHRGVTRRPAGVRFMHYECELAVVIGRPARRVKRAEAMAHVAGYTVANDYAIRDYLENWYRPNLRVKNRDGGTVLGPWFVPAAAIADPHALALRTRVDGRLTQQGNTRDMVHDIPALIEYLSAFMTLQPGDVILTGTPEGVVDVPAGSRVETEIDGIGTLVNTIVDDAAFGRG